MTTGSAEAPPLTLDVWEFDVYGVPMPANPPLLAISWSNALPALSVTGRLGNSYSLEFAPIVSTPMPWQSLMGQTSWVLTNSLQLFLDASAAGMPQRFYRVAPPAPAPLPSLVWISPGTFLMGSPTNETDRSWDEGPQTQVTLTHGFWMRAYPVTQSEYQAVIGINPSYFLGDVSRPADRISWEDATNFCGLLTQQERSAGRLPAGYAYRLPTEAEWEYAARAGTTTRFSYGDDPSYTNLANYAWYVANSGQQTHPVGQKQPNPWGLYGMYGNIEEWCSDYYGPYPGGSVTDPGGPTSYQSFHVVRGGGFASAGANCRSASRGQIVGENRYRTCGLRVILAPARP